MNLLLLPILLLLAVAEGTPPEPAQDSGAEQEWVGIELRVVPKIQKYRAASVEDRKAITFHREIAEIGAFVSKYSKADPDYSAAARVFLATELLDRTLGQAREASQILRSVVQSTASPLVSGMAALHACELFLREGDESSIEEVIEQYASRKDHDQGFLEMMGDLRKRVRLSPGRQFPDLPLVDLEGGAQGLPAHRGKVLLLFFFNAADDSADTALALCAELDRQWRDKGLHLLGVSVDRRREDLESALKKAEVTFPVVWDGKGWEGPVVKQLGISTVPVYFVVSRDGRIRFSWVRQVELAESVRTSLDLSDDDQDDGSGKDDGAPSGG